MALFHKSTLQIEIAHETKTNQIEFCKPETEEGEKREKKKPLRTTSKLFSVPKTFCM